MAENFELLDIGQIEVMHEQVHGRLDDGGDCDTLRIQHDSLAAELVKRGIAHDTEIVCPEIITDAPNYRRGFTDDICTNCAFGQLFPFCNLYKFDYLKGYTCDSFRYFEILELEPPHGFLMASGKQTAIASPKQIDCGKHQLIISNGEVFGIAELDEAAQMKTKEFDGEDWFHQHRITQRERRQWWPSDEAFYVYRLKDWQPYEGIKLFEDGKVVNEPRLTARQWQQVSKSKELPKQITLVGDAISITDNSEFIIDPSVVSKAVKTVLEATYEIDIKNAKTANEIIPIYSLALVRNPRMRVSKKNITERITYPELDELKKVIYRLGKKQEDRTTMPYRIVRQGQDYCVVEINEDGTDGEVEGRFSRGYAHHALNSVSDNVKDQKKSVWNKIESQGPRRNVDQMTYFISHKFKKQFDRITNLFGSTDFFDNFLIALVHGQKDNFFRVDYVDYIESDDNVIFAPQNQWVKVEEYYHPMGCKYHSSFSLGYKQEGEAMPFRIRKRGDEYCVVKINPDDSDGDTSGCHDTEEEAEAQLTALNINVTAEEGEGSIHPDKPKKRKPKKRKEAEVSEKEEKVGFIEGLKVLSKNIVDLLRSVEIEENKGELFVNDAGIAQKTVNGELWHFTWTTNAFRDREGEIFSTKSLEDFVIANEVNEDKGFFNLWHINAEDGNFNTDFAVKKWQGVVGRFLVEYGPYLDDEKGRASKKFFTEFANGHPEIAPEGWGCSPEYKYLPEERVTTVYDTIWITRTSTLPRMAAANIWTDTRQLNRGIKMTVSEKQIALAVADFGQEFVDRMISEGERKTAELEAANIDHKDNGESDTEDKTREDLVTPNQLESFGEGITKTVSEQFEKNNSDILGAMTTIADSMKKIGDRVGQLEGKDSVKNLAETSSFSAFMQRASGEDGTIVTDDDTLKNEKPTEAQGGKPDDVSMITPAQFFGTK